MRQFMTGAGPAGFYVPISQSDVGEFIRIAVRARGATMTITPDIRVAVESLDPNLPVYDVMSMQGVIAKETWVYWVLGEMFMAFGFIALFIACVGLYSVMCYAVRRRVKELGIRIALGANRPDLVRLVMTRAVAQMGIGIVLGIALAVSAAGPLQVLLYDVDALDPAVFVLVVLSLVVTGLLASLTPAHQVARLDPMLALTPE
jgi:putative ABC transport system permease protein